MLRLERLAVQLTEAARFLDIGTVPFLRLALELADGACEIQMYAECNHQLRWWRLRHPGEEKPGKTRQTKIDRDFNVKTEFLESLDRLDPVHGRALRRLHVYRNESHHQDALRPDTLESAVRILLYLSAQMITDYRPMSSRIVSGEEVPALTSLLADSTHGPQRFGVDLREPLAELIRERSGLTSMDHLAGTLAAHSSERWDGVVTALDFVVRYMRELDPSADRFQALERVLALANDESPDVRLGAAQRRQLRAFGIEQIMAIVSGPESIAAASTPLDAFQVFADFEDMLEPLEAACSSLAGWVDGYYQHRSDVARGK